MIHEEIRDWFDQKKTEKREEFNLMNILIQNTDEVYGISRVSARANENLRTRHKNTKKFINQFSPAWSFDPHHLKVQQKKIIALSSSQLRLTIRNYLHCCCVWESRLMRLNNVEERKKNVWKLLGQVFTRHLTPTRVSTCACYPSKASLRPREKNTLSSSEPSTQYPSSSFLYRTHRDDDLSSEIL